MDDTRRKKTADSNKEKHGASNKKRSIQEKKTKSDTTTSTSGSGLTDQSVDSIVVLGKSCSFVKSKSHESGYRLHECASETSIQPILDCQKLRDVPNEGILQIPSNASFISAKSDISVNDALLKKVLEIEKKVTMQEFRKEEEEEDEDENKDMIEVHSVSLEMDKAAINTEGFLPKLKEMEKKILGKEKIIAELNQKVKTLNKTKFIQLEENKKLNHQVNLLNRQLRSMYELIQSRNWNKPFDPAELTRLKNKSHELETLVMVRDEEKKKLQKRIDEVTSSLHAVETEYTSKSRELIEYKNRSALEMCKLLNQIDGLQKEAKTQSHLMELKILEVQNSMDDEIVNVTKKLEKQYQRDYDSALEKFQVDFKRLANLPKCAMEKLLNLCEPDKVSIIALQKEWDEQRAILEAKIDSFNCEHQKEVARLKDAYDSKLIFLKTQVESLTSQLIEKKEILKTFESELTKYKSQSSMNLLQTSSREDDISFIRQLYTAEIFSQKQVHKLEMNIFEEKVKTLTEEILYYAQNEEIHLNEIEKAKKMAQTFREKYELLVREWEEKVENDLEKFPNEARDFSELDAAFQDFKNLIHAMKTSEVNEKMLMKWQAPHSDKFSACFGDVEEFKSKLNQLENFQKAQARLDKTIKELIESIGMNYAKTVKALLTSHVTELSLKQLELYNAEKRFSNEISLLKNKQEKEVEELLNKLKEIKDSKIKVETELQSVEDENQDEVTKAKINELSLKLLKCEEMLSAKEEAETVLNEKIKELEYSMQVKDENSKKELENLVAKLLEVKILYSAKEDLAKELEDKVDNSEKVLEKSCCDIKKIYEICFLLDENLKKIGNLQSNDSGDCKSNMNEKFFEAKKSCEEIRKRLMEIFDEIDILEGKQLNVQNQKNSFESDISKESDKIQKDLSILREKYAELEAEKRKFVDYNKKLKVENEGLWQAITEMKKETGELSHLMEELKEMRNKVEEKEKERSDILLRVQLLSLEKDEMVERNKCLADRIGELTERVDVLMAELANHKGPEGDREFSFSLHAVRFLYEEEQETVSEIEGTPSRSSVACQVQTVQDNSNVENVENLWESSEQPKERNINLKPELKKKVSKEPRETSELAELKIMTETLHAQLENKTILCDELIIQKDILERELKGLKDLLKKNCSRVTKKKELKEENMTAVMEVEKTKLDVQNRQSPNCSPGKKPPTDNNVSNIVVKCQEDPHLVTLNLLKRQLKSQTELEEAQFRETLELEVKGLKREIEESFGKDNLGLEKLQKKDLIQRRYEEEVLELSREFEKEMEKLRTFFAQNGESDESSKKFVPEIEKLKSYFELKWTDMKNRYQDLYKIQKRERLEEIEIDRILVEFEKICLLQDENINQKSKAQKFLKEILKRHQSEINALQEEFKKELSKMEENNISEIEKLKTSVLQMKENIESALKNEENSEFRTVELEGKQKTLLDNLRAQFEKKLEKERKELNDLLEDIKQKHKKEMADMEEFWTEKLSECETKCAILKAARRDNIESRSSGNLAVEPEDSFCTERKQELSEKASGVEEQNTLKNEKAVEQPSRNSNFVEESLCVSCLSSQSYIDAMEMKTDDDKLSVIRERDELRETVSSLCLTIAKLLGFIGMHRTDTNDVSMGDFDETMYKSVHIDLDRSIGNLSGTSTSNLLALDLTTIVQEIKDNLFHNSSDQVRFELDRCLEQVKKDATSLLALSFPDTNGHKLCELVKKLEKEKNSLEINVFKAEEMQKELRNEIEKTKNKLSQWERNLEIISEGYGEEIVKPQLPGIDFKDKIKLILDDQPQDVNILDEICKEGNRLQEEWKQEKLDLQQQIDVADKQIHSLKKFLEEQAAEREQEREAFDKEIIELKDSLKSKERDNLVQSRTNREGGGYTILSLAECSVQALESQIKELTNRLDEAEKDKGIVEGEFQNAVKKIWSLREVIQDLEVQLAEVSEKELITKKKVDKLEFLLEEQTKINEELKNEFEVFKKQKEIKYSQHLKTLEEELLNVRREAEQVNPEALGHLKMNLREIEGILIRKAKDLEQLHVSSANVSCSSPSEEVSLRDQLDASRCSTPDEMFLNYQSEKMVLPFEEIDRLHEKLARHNRAEEIAMKYIRDLKMQIHNNRKAFEETQTERDVLLEKVDAYLKENSSLKVRLEEQRCNAGLLQKQLNANLESQINRLEVDVEKLNELCVEKDKQLRDLKEILENTTKALKMRESEALNKTKEENTLISALKTDLEIALNQNQELEKKLENVKEKLKDSLKVPVLIDSMIDEKNAEIDRLEKEVSRMSNEISTLATSKSSLSKNTKRIRFSEPDSFGGCISSISSQHPSTIRNFSDSADLKNSPFKFQQHFHSPTKVESVSSIGPLQLSPRGSNSSFDWKTSSPIFLKSDRVKSPQTKNEMDFQKMVEESKFRKEIESKQREISELHLEIDILKRQIVELNQELSTARIQTKEIQNDLESKEEETRKLKNNERSLLMTIESVKKKHSEEVEELQNKLKFERGKVEKIFEDIIVLEEKKIEIEESFFSLKEDYNEKLMREQKMAEALMIQVEELEKKNEKLMALTENLERESETMTRKLADELFHLREENDKLKNKCLNMSKSLSVSKVNVGIQVKKDGTSCDVCLQNLLLESPKCNSNLGTEELNELKKEFEKMAEIISETNFSRVEAFCYAMSVKRLLFVVLNNVENLCKELESHRKKVMESSVDDLAIKVQKELVLSAKLDRKLLSSIEVEVSESQPSFEQGAGDFVVPNGNDLRADELAKKITNLEREKVFLDRKVTEQAKTINLLEEKVTREKMRMLEERDRCEKDAKIMELLRVNLEKGFQDLKANEKELKKEKQMRMVLEKEVEGLKKQNADESQSKKMTDLNSQVESQKEKIISLNRCLEEEKKKNQELKYSLEQNKMGKMSEKKAQKLLETDLALLRQQKDDLNIELVKTKKLIDSRNAEINFLKRKINLQEIDIKALNALNDFHHQSTSDESSVMKTENVDDINLSHYQKNFVLPISFLDIPSPVSAKTKTAESCNPRHEVEEALFCLNRETERVREIIRKVGENDSKKAVDETLLGDSEVNRRLWALEKEGLLMEIETLKRDQEGLKRDLLNTCKINEVLKLENSTLKKEVKSSRSEVSGQIECSFFQDRIVHLTRKLIRTESYRKALAWQKNYLLISIEDYHRWEEEACKKMGRLSTKRKKKGKDKKKKTFRVAVLAVMAIFRMRYIVKKWQKSVTSNLLLHLAIQSHSSSRTLAPLASVLSIYNEPVDPLLYQTQNIFQSSSKVLRTPPSRDPGPQICPLGKKVASECLETLNEFKENVTARVSP